MGSCPEGLRPAKGGGCEDVRWGNGDAHRKPNPGSGGYRGSKPPKPPRPKKPPQRRGGRMPFGGAFKGNSVRWGNGDAHGRKPKPGGIKWGNGDAHRRPKGWGGGGGGDAHGLRRGGRTRPSPSRGRKFAAGRKIRPSIRNRTSPYGEMDPSGTGGAPLSYSCQGNWQPSGPYSNSFWPGHDPYGNVTGCATYTTLSGWMAIITAYGCDSSSCEGATTVSEDNDANVPGNWWCFCGTQNPAEAPIGGW